jgi:hypothetical protein
MNILKKFILNTRIFYLFIFLIFSTIFLAHYIVAGQAVYGDGIEYYAWLHSAYFDHDINFKNELSHMYNYEYNNGHFGFEGSPPELTKAGKVGNFHMPGMAILLFPFYFLADVVLIILNFLGTNLLRNGYSNIYQIVSGLGAVFYAMLGIFITEKLFTKLFLKIKINQLLTLRLSVITVVLASPLFYYLAIDILNSHFGTFFVTACFYYVLLLWKRSNPKFLLLGLLLSLATWVRIQEAVLIIPLVIILMYDYFEKVRLRSLIKYFFITICTFLITTSPLILIWQYLYGNILLHPYFFEFIRHTQIDWFGSLIDPTNGLFIKTPLMLFLLIAAPLAVKKMKKEFIIFFVFFIIQAFAIAKYGGWIAASFGGRMYFSSFPLFFLLAGFLFTNIKKKLLVAIILFFVLLNIINIFDFMLFSKQAANGRSGLEPTTKVKIEKILKLI